MLGSLFCSNDPFQPPLYHQTKINGNNEIKWHNVSLYFLSYTHSTNKTWLTWNVYNFQQDLWLSFHIVFMVFFTVRRSSMAEWLSERYGNGDVYTGFVFCVCWYDIPTSSRVSEAWLKSWVLLITSTTCYYHESITLNRSYPDSSAWVRSIIDYVCWKTYCIFRLCFTKLKLLLIAIEVKLEDGMTGTIAINPGPDAKVEAGTQGFFIAQSDEEAKR